MEVVLIIAVVVVGGWAVAKYAFGFDILEHLPKGEPSNDDTDPFDPKN